VVNCDSCFLYAAEDGDLIPSRIEKCASRRCSRLKLDWAGHHGWGGGAPAAGAVALTHRKDPRFQLFKDCRRTNLKRSSRCPVCAAAGLWASSTCRTATHTNIRSAKSIDLDHGSWSERKSRWRGSKAENLHLSEKLETRKIVERAKGFSSANSESREEAYLTIQRQSRQRRKSIERGGRGHRPERRRKTRFRRITYRGKAATNNLHSVLDPIVIPKNATQSTQRVTRTTKKENRVSLSVVRSSSLR